MCVQGNAAEVFAVQNHAKKRIQLLSLLVWVQDLAGANHAKERILLLSLLVWVRDLARRIRPSGVAVLP